MLLRLRLLLMLGRKEGMVRKRLLRSLLLLKRLRLRRLLLKMKRRSGLS